MEEVKEKKCSRCKMMLLIVNFYKCNKSKDGRRYECKDCKKRENEKNSEAYKKYWRERYTNNIEQIKIKKKESYKKNIDKHRQYREKNKQKISLAMKQWRSKNKERLDVYQKEYRKNNPKIYIESRRRLGFKKINEITDEYVLKLLTAKNKLKRGLIKGNADFINIYRLKIKAERLLKNKQKQLTSNT